MVPMGPVNRWILSLLKPAPPPYEAAWLLGLSESAVYESVPRIQAINSKVRFDPKVIKELRKGSPSQEGSSLKIEKELKSVDLLQPNPTTATRNGMWGAFGFSDRH